MEIRRTLIYFEPAECSLRSVLFDFGWNFVELLRGTDVMKGEDVVALSISIYMLHSKSIWILETWEI
jgi:hypothetical protein